MGRVTEMELRASELAHRWPETGRARVGNRNAVRCILVADEQRFEYIVDDRDATRDELVAAIEGGK